MIRMSDGPTESTSVATIISVEELSFIEIFLKFKRREGGIVKCMDNCFEKEDSPGILTTVARKFYQEKYQ